MRSLLRSLTIALAALLCVSAMAQNYDCLGVLNGTALPGTLCYQNFVWSPDCTCDTAAVYDCLGVLNGTALPGTPCDDGDSTTVNDHWTNDCVCVGDNNNVYDCLGVLNGTALPGTLCYQNFVWSPDCTCDTAAVYDCLGVLNGTALPGTPCDDGDSLTVNDHWNDNCVCIGDSGNFFNYDCLGVLNGTALPGTLCYQNFVWSPDCTCDTAAVYDCLGVLNGTALPGTPCDDGDSLTVNDHWTNDCVCVGDNNSVYDCLGVLNGTALPGTPCDDGDSLTVNDHWTNDCVCIGYTSNVYDCLGVLNGTALPGTPCDDGDSTTVNDTWTNDCVCVGDAVTPCDANFWVVQAWNGDSLNPQPVPYELWLWNLSNGGSGTYTFQWSFGDGATSSDPYPTHTYSGNGPYDLCLTIDDGAGCTDTYCDSVSVDNNGIYTGIMGGNDHHSAGFTINVQHAVSTGVAEIAAFDAITLWPNPVQDQLNIAINSNLSRSADLTIYDMNGKIVWNGNKTLIQGHNNITVPVGGLDPGMYVVRFGNIANTSGMRFVKG